MARGLEIARRGFRVAAAPGKGGTTEGRTALFAANLWTKGCALAPSGGPRHARAGYGELNLADESMRISVEGLTDKLIDFYRANQLDRGKASANELQWTFQGTPEPFCV